MLRIAAARRGARSVLLSQDTRVPAPEPEFEAPAPSASPVKDALLAREQQQIAARKERANMGETRGVVDYLAFFVCVIMCPILAYFLLGDWLENTYWYFIDGRAYAKHEARVLALVEERTAASKEKAAHA